MPTPPPAAPELRRLCPADAPAYRELMLEASALHPEAFTSSVAERAAKPLAWWQARVAEGTDVAEWVMGAFIGSRLVGAAGLSTETREKTRHKATLFGMYLRPEARRQGLGGQLVKRLLDQARARPGLRQVQLTVSEGNLAAQTLYRRCGFTIFGVEPMAMAHGDGFVGKVHMVTLLAAREPATRPTTLRPLPPEHFARYCEMATANYAQENRRAGRCAAEQALQQAQADFAALLPQGPATPGHFFCEIADGPQGPVVGWLWWAIDDRRGARSAFVYDLMILPPARRRGHGRGALQALEPLVRTQGLGRIGLHVFQHNPGAQALYAELGYGVTGLNMAKILGD